MTTHNNNRFYHQTRNVTHVNVSTINEYRYDRPPDLISDDNTSVYEPLLSNGEQNNTPSMLGGTYNDVHVPLDSRLCNSRSTK